MVYNPLSGETLFDVAVKLYQDVALGIDDILNLNPGINLNSELYGTPITYTEGLTREKEVFEIVPRETIRTYKTISLQSVYDLAVQLYGDISKIGILLELFPNLNDTIALGSEVEVEEQTDPIAVYFLDKRVATDILAPVGEIIFRRVDTADSDLRVTDTGDIRIIAQ